jgi:hypothetical protein
MKRSLLPISCLVLGLGIVMGAVMPAQAADEKVAEKAKNIDLVLCIDTSNSMDGLIASAKAKLWDIVNELAKAKPTPNLRVALYSYGNTNYEAGKGWVRKDLDFTTDLDKVNEKLFALSTRGGTELVARVTKAALDELKWSEDAGALKILFVCGNEAADQDKQNTLKDVAEQACRKGVIVNTIYCGRGTDAVASGWKGFSDLAEGRYANIDQNRGTVAISTPYDKKLTELGTKINDTYVWYGKEGAERRANQIAQDQNAAKSGAPAFAGRVQAKGGELYKQADADLVDRATTDKNFDLKKIPDAELPEAMRKMTPEQREKHLNTKIEERRAIQKEIQDLSKQREDYIKEQTKKNPNPTEAAFDEAVRGMIREQGAKKGVKIPE